MCIVIFGERPGPNTDPERPLFPHTTTGAAAKLIAMLGMTEEMYLHHTIRYNVVDDRETPTTALWVRQRVRDRLLLWRQRSKCAKFIVLGRSAAAAFPPQYRYQPFGYSHGDVIIIPHTSGVNRFYNSEANIRFIKQSLRDFLGRS